MLQIVNVCGRGWKIASKGIESLYEQFGFIKRPNDHAGAALEMWIEK